MTEVDYDNWWSTQVGGRESLMDNPVSLRHAGYLWIEFFNLKRLEAFRDIIPRYIHPCMNIIDIGCGNSVIAQVLNGDSKVHLTGMDISKTLIEHNKKKWPEYDWVVGDAVNPGSDTYDMVHVGEVVEHLEERDRIMSMDKWCSMLNENGIIIITTPTPTMKIPIGQHRGFVNEGDVRRSMKKHGIRLIETHGIGIFLPLYAKIILSIKNTKFRNRLYSWLLDITYNFTIAANQAIYIGRKRL